MAILHFENQTFIKHFNFRNDCFEVLYDVENMKIICFYLLVENPNFWNGKAMFVKINDTFDTIIEIYPHIEVINKDEYSLNEEVTYIINAINNNLKTKNSSKRIGCIGWRLVEKKFDGFYYMSNGLLFCDKGDGTINFSYADRKINRTKLNEYFRENSNKIENFLNEINFDLYFVISKRKKDSYKGQILLHFEGTKILNFINNKLNVDKELQSKLNNFFVKKSQINKE